MMPPEYGVGDWIAYVDGMVKVSWRNYGIPEAIEHYAPMLRHATGRTVVLDMIDGGIHVKTVQVEGRRRYVDVLRMLGGNWRLVLSHEDRRQGYSRGWCYAGPLALPTVLYSAVKWDGQPNTEPSGWVKDVMDDRRHGAPKDGVEQQ